ncbi:unnamed protein product [Adineta steineri]|uniref:Peptidase C1A papain C-terminal domain-containing protein n=1 Tax=Adineta steineri TaxID=433720 RepID=A0A814NFE7_9BILA|nr:unnamed protein product [Adineta steineri]CAF3941725.1 unnamed protein product [Adineta steineri]
MGDTNFVADPATGRTYCIGGCLFNGNPSDLPKFGASNFLSDKKLPKTVDLRTHMTKIEDQGQCNSCVGNALAGAYEFLIKKRTGKTVDVSRLFIYYNSRREDGLQEYNMADQGTFIRSAIEALKKQGCCKENLYKYDVKAVNAKPSSHCYEEARKYPITDAMSLRLDLNEMKTCLAEGYPFAFGLYVYQSFMQFATLNKGYIPMPKSHEISRGGHAMLAAGYSDEKQCFIVRNSFGEDWGDKGYCYIPYAYMCDSRKCVDLHAVKLIADGSCRRQKDKESWEKKHSIDHATIPVSSDIWDDVVDYERFWNFDDPFEYINKKWHDTLVPHFHHDVAHPKHFSSYHSKIISRKNNYPMRYILWIDKQNADADAIVSHLTHDNSLQIDFYDSLSAAEKHLLNYINQIRSSSTFQIICHGHYEQEKKNPLNLLEFLNHHGLQHIPVLAFTRNTSALQHRLQMNAPSMGIHDWTQRLTIIDRSEDLTRKCKENMKK